MTIEEKAKAYDEALERAKAYHRNELAGTRQEMTEYIFPELRESEDETIRNEILAYIGSKLDINLETHNRWCSYLEKQKEQKPAERVEINKSLTEAVIAELSKYNSENHCKSPWAIDSTGLQYPLYFANLGATWQKEQKPVEWNEEDKDNLNNIIWLCENCEKGIENVWIPSQATQIKNLIKSLRPSWKPSEEQMTVFQNTMQRLLRAGGTGKWYAILESLYEQLKKL